MRVVKYSVQYAFVSNDKNIVGGLPAKDMNLKEIEYMLRLLSPLKSSEMVSTISALPRHSFTTMTFDEMVSEGVVLTKCLKIMRS